MHITKEDARRANARYVTALREAMLKQKAAKPAEFGLNLIEKLLAGSTLDKILSVSLLCAIVHHSLKNVSNETFVAEIETAMNDYTDYMIAKGI